ncbi:MAG: hypothetical protein LBJ90_02550 [Treponema sp.]|jgi:hypothetical protein|nr:hypothetical protein [Treponema sp.]
MTLSERNICFKAGIVLAALSIAAVVAASVTIIPARLILEETAIRSAGIFQALISRFLKPAPYSVYASIAGAVLYALITATLIYYFFEKTQSPEILFVFFFVLSFAVETTRFMLPLRRVYEIPSLYQLMAARTLLFGRYFGIFSLFIASVYATGLEVQKQRTITLVIVVATMIIALGVPVDILTWDTSFNMVNGYTSLFRLIEIGTFLITIVSFFIASYIRGSREYIFVGLGAFLVFLGRNILINGDTWASPLPGILFLSLGAWFICTQLHKIYLWL